MEDLNKEYTNGEVVVIWKPRLCDHNGACITSLPGVFNIRKKPWINMQGASTPEIIDTVLLCPTGALTYRLEGDEINTAPEKEVNDNVTIISLMEDGPMRISGNFKIVDTNGAVLKSASKAVLCRCGKTKRNPYCDGSHRNK